ncbi:MAG: hypothetical protein COU90_02065 [Candidatus Ryanbacteria bacterium CG10_big_fil_rev_8_21_14_0_10_43_42]|uniref:SGNH hydrolase-type esterase domain-containing protein n=1 Tax=Candidatus Ryanbacteria bacterium CG10_big_fil_rev_8_21_14_0_10_43_42 TaxID=1974864 RepID=A0A2M8KXJ1_9BACT|nr:MAG: hypothetical protein COU90_02065 [Candidatus Ryanbacteria bacterium CG10_big_fil_rev_8_21_14_0_10_43_42]
MNGNSKQAVFFFILGIITISSGLFFNEWLIAHWISFSGSLKISDRIIIWVIDILLVVGGAILLRHRNTIHIGKAEFFLLTGTLVLLLVFSEGAARIIDNAHGGDFAANKARAERPIIPFRMFGPVLYEKTNEGMEIIGRHGERYPFEKGEDTFRIVALGGSTTQNRISGIHYPLVLEQLLQEQFPEKKIEVINAGNSAYATPHLITLLSLDIISWNPDLIIVSENINDLTVSYFPDFSLDYSNKYKNETFIPYPSRLQALFGWSRLYWIMRSRKEALTFRLLETSNAVYNRKSYGDQAPEEGKAVFKRNLDTIVDVAEAHAIPVILATQPLEPSEEYWDRHMRYKTYNTITVYPLHNEFVLHHKDFNATIKEVAEEKEVFFIDNDAVFGGERELFTDFVHYTKEGVEVLAHSYFDFITERNIIR